MSKLHPNSAVAVSAYPLIRRYNVLGSNRVPLKVCRIRNFPTILDIDLGVQAYHRLAGSRIFARENVHGCYICMSGSSQHSQMSERTSMILRVNGSNLSQVWKIRLNDFDITFVSMTTRIDESCIGLTSVNSSP